MSLRNMKFSLGLTMALFVIALANEARAEAADGEFAGRTEEERAVVEHGLGESLVPEVPNRVAVAAEEAAAVMTVKSHR